MALALTLKRGEGIQIGEDIYIKFERFEGDNRKIRIAINAPRRQYPINRIGQIDDINNINLTAASAAQQGENEWD